jgi:hypothetical protein
LCCPWGKRASWLAIIAACACVSGSGLPLSGFRRHLKVTRDTPFLDAPAVLRVADISHDTSSWFLCPCGFEWPLRATTRILCPCGFAWSVRTTVRILGPCGFEWSYAPRYEFSGKGGPQSPDRSYPHLGSSACLRRNPLYLLHLSSADRFRTFELVKLCPYSAGTPA